MDGAEVPNSENARVPRTYCSWRSNPSFCPRPLAIRALVSTHLEAAAPCFVMSATVVGPPIGPKYVHRRLQASAFALSFRPSIQLPSLRGKRPPRTTLRSVRLRSDHLVPVSVVRAAFLSSRTSCQHQSGSATTPACCLRSNQAGPAMMVIEAP